MSDQLPCGCVMQMDDDTFIFVPCSTSCRWLAYVQEESARQGKPLTVLDAR